MAVVYLNEKDFDEQVIKAEGLVLVDFYADWCGPCKMMGPVLEKIADEFADVKICKVNTDENQSLTMNYGVSSIPAFYFFKNGEIKKKVIGAVSRTELVNVINEYK